MSRLKEHILKTALQLFYQHGFHATGIDAILAEAGVAKMTLYKHFKSKQELILASLARRDEDFRSWFNSECSRRGQGKPPAEALLVIFDVVAEWFAGEFYGCAFVNASAEFSRHDDPVHMQAADHKQRMLEALEELARRHGVARPRELAEQLDLLISGSVVRAQVTNDRSVVERARAAGEVLIRRALEH